MSRPPVHEVSNRPLVLAVTILPIGSRESTPEYLETAIAAVLGAGAIHPKEGFKYALENGADFLCVGMFDFQVEQDVAIAHRILTGDLKRQRLWCA